MALAEYAAGVIQKAAVAALSKAMDAAAVEVSASLRDVVRAHKTWTIGRSVSSLQYVRTLFSAHKNVSIFDFYYRTTLADAGSRRSIDTIEQLATSATIDTFDELSSYRNCVITGTAGQGKSVFARYLCLQQARAMADGRIPLFIELRDLETLGGSLQSLISERFREIGIIRKSVRIRGFATAEEVIDYLYEHGKIILVLDGFDEVMSLRQRELARQLEKMSREYPRLQLIITTRPDTPICYSSDFSVFEIENLTSRDLRPFLTRILKNERTIDALVAAVQQESAEIRTVLATPLMVTLLCILYLSTQTVPRRLVDFYDNVFDVLLYRHDVTKAGFKRERFTGLSETELSEVFRSICFVSRSAQLVSFRRDEWSRVVGDAVTLIQGWNAPETANARRRGASTGARRSRETLITTGAPEIKREAESLRMEATRNLCLLVEEGTSLSFIHKSVQEFLSAKFVQRADEEFAVAFYETIQGSFGSFWEPELQFLAEIDTRRYARMFWLPEFRRFCGRKQIVATRKGEEARLETGTDTASLVLNEVLFGFWIEKESDQNKFARPDTPQVVLPSGRRSFEATLRHLWQAISSETLRMLDGYIVPSVQNLQQKAISTRQSAHIAAARKDYPLDPSLCWFGAHDLLSLQYGAREMAEILARFMEGLEEVWKGFRSVERSEQRRHDFLIDVQKRMQAKAAKPRRRAGGA